jgi:hypothetical protein
VESKPDTIGPRNLTAGPNFILTLPYSIAFFVFIYTYTNSHRHPITYSYIYIYVWYIYAHIGTHARTSKVLTTRVCALIFVIIIITIIIKYRVIAFFFLCVLKLWFQNASRPMYYMTTVQMFLSNKFGWQIIKTLLSDRREDKRIEYNWPDIIGRHDAKYIFFFHTYCSVYNSIEIQLTPIESTPDIILRRALIIIHLCIRMFIIIIISSLHQFPKSIIMHL